MQSAIDIEPTITLNVPARQSIQSVGALFATLADHVPATQLMQSRTTTLETLVL